jgi:hypothetical protein
MIPSHLIEQIREDTFLNYMLKPVLKFDRYLDDTNSMSIRIRGIRYDQRDDEGQPLDPLAVEADIGYIHRWTKTYDNRLLCKLYNLQYYYVMNPKKMPKFTMMITLTGSHASPCNPGKLGLRHMAYLAKFHEAHRREKDMLKHYLKTIDYLSILEAHPTSGYVHAHDNYFLNELPSEKTLGIIENHWNKTQKMGSREHGIKIEIKEPKDFRDIKSFIAYPLAYLGKTTIGALPEWTKYDVIFNTCLWLSGKHRMFGGIGKHVRAFQPSRSLSAIMNKQVIDSQYFHLETMLKNRSELRSIYKSPQYDDDIKTWIMFGGDNEQFATLENVKFCKRMDKLIDGFIF